MSSSQRFNEKKNLLFHSSDLIAEVKKIPGLWNWTLPAYYNQTYKNKMWAYIAENLVTKWHMFSEEEQNDTGEYDYDEYWGRNCQTSCVLYNPSSLSW